MRKILSVQILLLLCLLCGCGSFLENRISHTVNSDRAVETMAYELLDQVIAAINNKDKDQMKSAMSIYMTKEGLYIDEGIDYIFEFAENEILSYEIEGLHMISDGVRPGGKWISSGNIIKVNTDGGGEYTIAYSFYARNDEEPEKIGIYRLSIFTSRDEYVQQDYDGIYVPDDYLKAWKEKQAEASGAEDAETAESSATNP